MDFKSYESFIALNTLTKAMLGVALLMGSSLIFFIFTTVAMLTFFIWIWFLPLLMLLTAYLLIQKGQQILIFTRIVLKLSLFDSDLSTQEWKFVYETFLGHETYEQVETINFGYALLSEDGVYLDNFKNHQFALNFQLYDFAILISAQIKNMKDKNLLEIGCGRGGGLRYVIDEFHPKLVTGVDISQENVKYCKDQLSYQKQRMSNPQNGQSKQYLNKSSPNLQIYQVDV